MKRIEAIIRPSKLEDIKEALKNNNINGVTISQVMGCGQQRGWKEYHRGTEIVTNVLPKIEVKIVVEDEKVEDVIELITKIARTGEVGDGKIFVVDIAECVRIRTGERGNSAL
ncbi:MULTISPECIES: P-II family nitrogen regulator [Clostridium]|jgi:nitrogen regulatory protein P-II 1|uniref:Nitrogen regulatory protein P-II n=1 Tax=Clostridium saccharoperbutylacetonicum N1-4(HMT) TaxID=931276 RepID=M1N7X6_9CLOT|nr:MULTISPECIES: P-II family nitrogen regulator [Clostridium]AGF59472.1 nitrogen regulatory protein P-II [Clostridium saccharoperbutylacetonicum N1-4(HMT)]AQR98160.1 nitrogen regulatory protein P-II [Clostridium saccharoperbutylacetonicum]NRT59734.1 nitrogen regulatory protein P-II 1 [Clostridium saccharoperbutylacetonicum]NSB28927.1 nitrogen regulatory protein P-II 1 [Clostridium saccharoperbutylacetonicum]NSB34054.1 nitrogen regulatory protein P-II 1 [Clostridium saccharoperbutylacetonicum]